METAEVISFFRKLQWATDYTCSNCAHNEGEHVHTTPDWASLAISSNTTASWDLSPS